MSTAPHCLVMHPDDNVAIVANDGGLPAGTVMPGGIALREHIPQAHKFALRSLAAKEPVLRYGTVIGYAAEPIPQGGWVSEARLRMPAPPELSAIRYTPYDFPEPEPLTGYTFEGYRNPDGSVGTRNLLAIGTTVQCVAGVVEYAVKRIKEELLPQYPNVDGVVPIQHVYGCGVAIEAPDAVIPIRTIRNIMRNPNFGGNGMLVTLGCEKLTLEKLLPLPFQNDEPYAVTLQDDKYVGFESMVAGIMEMAEQRLAQLDKRRRETCPASDIVLAMECGGSDAFSGAAANPALGYASDLLVRAGATVFFSENTEVRDGIERLVAKAASKEVADGLIREMAWYDAYLAKGGADRSANTTPGNKKGGLNNIVEKALGTIAKAGNSPIVGVHAPGEKIPVGQKGLHYVATPASDIVCSPLQVAAGANILTFVTGRGTPYGLAEVPVLKVGTRNDLARRWHDLIDYNAGPVVEGEKTIEEAGRDLFRLILETASGRKTWAEKWGLCNYMAIFNPAPIT